MRATSLDDLQVYKNAKAAEELLTPILERAAFRRDATLLSQIHDAMVKVAPNIAEGFGQGTDRHCAHYQYVARGACNEIQAHLGSALTRRHISASEHASLCERYTIVGKQLTRWIQHLNREDRKHRG